jgi:DNA polymerase-1
MITLGEQAEQALRAVREAKLIAYDVETSGLDVRRCNNVGYVITESAENNWYIPVRHAGGANLNDPNCGPLQTPHDISPHHRFEIELAKAFAERRQKGLITVGHNIKFDMHMSAKHGIMVGRDAEDTQLNEAMLNEFARSFSLASCATYHGVTAKKGEELYEHLARLFGGKADRKIMSEYWRTAGDDEIAVDYAKGDGITTLELRDSQMVKIEAEDMAVIHRVESRLIWTTFRMEFKGIKADEEYIGELLDGVDKKLAAAMEKLPARFNVRSGPQMKKLMEEAGHLDWPTTELGNPSFTEKWLKGHEAGKAVIAVRQLTNLKNTFVLPLKDRHIVNGRIHTTLHQLKADEFGTISGRYSCSDPNLQAIHKRNKELGRLFRAIFIADEGKDFWEGDYSQCEPRLYAHYSQEPALLNGYNSSPFRDVHDVVAQMLQVERDPTAKRMNMGIFTGMQPKTFASHMEWPLDRAAAAHADWFAAFPGIRNFQDTAKKVFRSRGYVRTIMGRRCRLDDARFAYRGVSRIIQGSNADILKYMLLVADEFAESVDDELELLMTVHDSVNWQAPSGERGEKMSREMIALCSDVQCEPFNLRVPFVMDTGHGKNWAIATYGEPK